MDNREFKEKSVLWVLQDRAVPMVAMAVPDSRARVDQPGRKGFRGLAAFKVSREFRGFKEKLDLRAFPEMMDNRVLRGLWVLRGVLEKTATSQQSTNVQQV
jgi:hypothetical protein